MTRLFEFIVALLMVAVLGVVVGVALPSSGHVERSLVFSKNIRDMYDIFNNFHRFPEYSVLRAFDPKTDYQFDGKAYGPGAAITWSSDSGKVGNGRLEIASAVPGFDQVDTQGRGRIVWNLTNNWRGKDKHFTIDLERTGRRQKLVKVTWAYDVDYGWNLIDRYSSLYIHGTPDQLIQFSMENLQTLVSTIPNIDYGSLDPKLVDTPQQPMLYVSTKAKRTLDDVETATNAALDKLEKAMKKLGVHAVGPRITFTTNYGDQNYQFDVAVPIDSNSLKIDGQEYQLTAPVQPKLDDQAPASDSSTAAAGSVASAASAPASASTAAGDNGDTAKAAEKPLKPGDRDKYGHLIVNDSVRGMLGFGGRALMASWTGNPAGIPPTRLALEAYALTHGYTFDDVTHREYDIQRVAYGSKDAEGKDVAYDKQTFDVYLPVQWSPAQTPEQEAAAQKQMQQQGAPAAASSSAPAAAGSAPAPASTAPATADSAE